MAPRGLATLLLPTLASAQYNLVQKVQGTDFFNAFDFWTSSDPTHGFVNYVDQSTAQNNGLIYTTSETAYIGVDYTTTLASDGSQGGRQSVRLTSQSSYTEGLFILDAEHMPGGICGTWPAWWTVGPNWPNNGEIDIIEGVNSATSNLMSLHTSNDCTTAGSGETGSLVTSNCYEDAAGQSNSGCGVTDGNPSSYGSGFNGGPGGVYAMEWTSSAIRVWTWPRNSIPADVQGGYPDPSTWGTPVTNFQGSCDIPTHFAQHNIVFDTTFCGDWAGNVWGSDSTCSRLASSCQDYVAGNPGAFKDAYWLINYMSVYQSSGEGDGPEPSVDAARPDNDVEIASVAANPDPTIKNAAAGATGQPIAQGAGFAPKVAPAKLDQEPAILNMTMPATVRMGRMGRRRG